MALIGMQEVTIAFGGPPLLDAVTVQIEAGERVCLVGRNGAGKSTFLKLLTGEQKPDTGELVRQAGLRVSVLPQDLPAPTDYPDQSVFEVVARGQGAMGDCLADYHHLMAADDHSEAASDRLHELQHSLDTGGGWNVQQRVDTAISRVELDAEAQFNELSGGQQRKALLARALANEPDILLLDEPTNHLDLEAIQWMESFLPRFVRTLVFITHDRVFLQALATRILEIDRGKIGDWRCDYTTYLKRRQVELEAEEKQAALFDKKLAQEEAWIRQGVKARRTRNEGRVKALQELRKVRSGRRERTGQVSLQMETAERSGTLVAKLEKADFGYGDKKIVKDLTITLMRGDKLGILGPNGAGKTTLLKGLLGGLEPQAGKVKLGTGLQIAYFDQLRSELDPTLTLVDTIAEGKESVTINGKSRHVMGYLQDFLFSPERARSPVSVLSGGERNRLVLARVFTRPANLLVLDEPTNDLDMETLELLEALLMEFAGTVLLVSHDRAFLDNVATSTLAWEGDCRFREYVGGYSDYERERERVKEAATQSARATTAAAAAQRTAASTGSMAGAAPAAKGKKLSYKEAKELEELPLRIEALEEAQAEAAEQLAAPELYRAGGSAVADANAKVAKLQADLTKAYERWTELDTRQNGG